MFILKKEPNSNNSSSKRLVRIRKFPVSEISDNVFESNQKTSYGWLRVVNDDRPGADKSRKRTGPRIRTLGKPPGQ